LIAPARKREERTRGITRHAVVVTEDREETMLSTFGVEKAEWAGTGTS